MNPTTIKDTLTYIAVSIVPILVLILTIMQYRLQKRQTELENISKIIQSNNSGDNYIDIDNSIHYHMQMEADYSEQNYLLKRKLENLEYLNKLFNKLSPIVLVFIYGLNLINYLLPFPKYPSSNALIDNLVKYLKFILLSMYKAVFPTITNFLWLILLLLITLMIRKFILKGLLQKIAGNIALAIIAFSYFKTISLVKEVKVTNLPEISAPSLVAQNQTTSITIQTTEIISSFSPEFIIIFSILSLIFLWTISSHLIDILFESFGETKDFKRLKFLFPRLVFYLFMIIIVFLITLGVKTIQ
ncbi:hypothetical protein [Lactococcus allomyrinae]|uniref:Uncharacterized protein n=1 Tax=Lactococcus allomyrinae TaxID=2419773 RepID=A0A387BJQ0_9LACT|nr:hypothetical protein [Lactococcus allomyrinae]AYG01160.1 hypothetical protein D7I46_08655 [Lactococcus allomyrinae]